jgi:hypothetical protein
VIGSYLPERPESDQNGIEITDFSTWHKTNRLCYNIRKLTALQKHE